MERHRARMPLLFVDAAGPVCPNPECQSVVANLKNAVAVLDVEENMPTGNLSGDGSEICKDEEIHNLRTKLGFETDEGRESMRLECVRAESLQVWGEYDALRHLADVLKTQVQNLQAEVQYAVLMINQAVEFMALCKAEVSKIEQSRAEAAKMLEEINHFKSGAMYAEFEELKAKCQLGSGER